MKRNRINLINKTKAQSQKKEFPIDITILTSSCLVVLIIFFISFRQIKKTANIKNQITRLNTKNNEYDKQISKIKFNNVQIKNIDKTKETIEEVISQKSDWANLFKELSFIAPSNIWLTDLNIINNKGILSYSISGHSPRLNNISNFFNAVEKSNYFNQAIMNSSALMPNIQPTLYSFDFSTPDLSKEKNRKVANQKEKFSNMISSMVKDSPLSKDEKDSEVIKGLLKKLPQGTEN